MDRSHHARRHSHTHALQQRQQPGSGIYWSEDGVSSSMRPCDSAKLSWSGGVPPYTLQGRWWPADSNYTDDTAREWIIASGIQHPSYDWLATVPANSTVWVDAFDSVLTPSTTMIFQVNYTTPSEPDSTWCMSRYPDAAAASPGVRIDLRQAAAVITSGAVATTNTPAYTLAPSRNGVSGANSTSNSSQTEQQYGYKDMSGTIAGLSISVGVLSLAFLILLFLHVRLRKRYGRSERGTIGKWSKRHFDDDAKELDDDADRPLESFTVTRPKAVSFFSSRKDVKPLSFSGASLFSSQSATTSRLSSFFENRSASRTGQNNNNDNNTNSASTRESSSNTINPFEDYSETMSTSFNRSTSSTYNGNFSSKRYSTAETTISESNTIQSGTESHFSTALSEQASTVGGISAISDEHYHRRKATTISPTATSGNIVQKFLSPGR